MGGNWWVEVLFLAMLAGFIALRLVSVLGRRTGHEPAAGDAYRPGGAEKTAPAPAVVEGRARPLPALPDGLTEGARSGLTAIAGADGGFDPERFLDGAKSAYRMILTAFWSGDLTEVEPFIADDVADWFRRAIAARQEAGLTVENRLVAIDTARIMGAQLDGSMAEVSVHFEADVAGVTRDREGRVIAGAVGEVTRAADEWAFRRHVRAGDPNWLLVSTVRHED